MFQGGHRAIGRPCAFSIVTVAAALLLAASTTSAGTLGGPLELQDEGSFFIGGQLVLTNHARTTAGPTPGHIMVNQMYVQYRIPKTVSNPPIVMVHGSGHTGVTYETTPDGREGWATYFTRKGFPVYVVDHSGRGRSSFDPTQINRAKAEWNPALLPEVPLLTRERAWPIFRFGKTHPATDPDSQFPLDAIDQYFSQIVPNTEVTLGGGGANTVKALAMLLDRIGPAIVLVHSQSGAYGLELVRLRSDKMRAFVDVEGNCAPVSNDDITKHFVKVPMTAVFGDFSADVSGAGASGISGDDRLKGCIATTDALRKAGGNAKLMLLPELGVKGNSHMMMMDKNNLQVADLIIAWIGEVTAKPLPLEGPTSRYGRCAATKARHA